MKAFPAELRWAARWKLQYLHEAADLRDLKSPPSARRLERRLEGVSLDTVQRSMASGFLMEPW